MKKFKGTAICQFNVEIKVSADDPDEAYKVIDKFLDDSFKNDFQYRNFEGKVCDFNYDECFEILDIMEVK